MEGRWSEKEEFLRDVLQWTDHQNCYPQMPILVGDDSFNPRPRRDVDYVQLPADMGLSAGRNALLACCLALLSATAAVLVERDPGTVGIHEHPPADDHRRRVGVETRDGQGHAEHHEHQVGGGEIGAVAQDGEEVAVLLLAGATEQGQGLAGQLEAARPWWDRRPEIE